MTDMPVLRASAGQPEPSIHERFIAFSKVKVWSSRPDCPEVIQECRTIYDNLYPDSADIHDAHSTSTAESEEEDGESQERVAQRSRKRTALPIHLRSLLPVSPTISYARHVYRGVVYSTSSCHEGNSLVLVRPSGSLSKEGVPGIIEDICLNERDEVVYAVRLYAPLRRGLRDPFRSFPDFPARAFSPELLARPCIIRPQWVVGHFARYRLRPDAIAVLSLSKVSD